jgi:hypothetical protein
LTQVSEGAKLSVLVARRQMMIRKYVFLVMLVLGIFARAAMVFAAAQLLPEHQQRIGTCPGGGTCAWDCNGSQCEFGFSKQICEIDTEC